MWLYLLVVFIWSRPTVSLSTSLLHITPYHESCHFRASACERLSRRLVYLKNSINIIKKGDKKDTLKWYAILFHHTQRSAFKAIIKQTIHQYLNKLTFVNVGAFTPFFEQFFLLYAGMPEPWVQRVQVHHMPFVFITFWVQCGCRLWVQRVHKRFQTN